MTMNIALVDDEQRQLDILNETLTSAISEFGFDTNVIDTFASAEKFLECTEKGKYDIIILDIYMNDMNGIDVARRIREVDENVILAFCTSSNEYASQSYEVDARFYLQKPISKEKVSTMLRRFNLEKLERNKRIRLPDGSQVPLRQIIYAEYINHSVRFHIKGCEPHTIRTSQSEVETLLLVHKSFCVINKGCIVNLAQVKSIETNAFILKNGITVPIARRRFKDIESAYTDYLFEKMDKEDID